MEIAVRIEPNGRTYIDKNLRPEIDYTQPPYNFTIKTIDDKYSDCEGVDFDGLEFSVELYNHRKHLETIPQQIAQLKAELNKYKEDVEQVELFGMERADYQEKKARCAEIIIELRKLESEVRDVSL